MGQVKQFRVLAVTAAAGLALAATAAAVPPAESAAPAARTVPVTHVIEIMVENHSFDSLFGSFSGANGIPANVSLANPAGSGPAVHPVWATANEGDVTGEIDNSRAAELTAMDSAGGRYLMDRYTTVPQDGMAAITEFGPQFDPDEQYLAAHYELADDNFQPVIGPTQPNVMTALTGTDHGWLTNAPEPAQPWNSIFDELTKYGRSWKIYYALPPAELAGAVWPQLLPAGHAADLTTGPAFFADLAAGHLPDFSFVRPGVSYSSEPPEDITEADAWIGQLVNAVAHSKYWDSTAIFVSYDESGGFWDHVAPATATGYGARTPLIIISPYARPGIYRAPTTNVSVLSFVQKLCDMPALTPLNARQDNLLGAFDFGQAPRPAPAVPVAPADTIGFHGAGGILTDLSPVHSDRPQTVNLEAETGGLVLDRSVNGTVKLAVTPPPGARVPSSFPASAQLAGGQADITVSFPSSGYWRITAAGPGGAQGWVTVDVGVSPDTVP
jgi:phospholipase C